MTKRQTVYIAIGGVVFVAFLMIVLGLSKRSATQDVAQEQVAASESEGGPRSIVPEVRQEKRGREKTTVATNVLQGVVLSKNETFALIDNNIYKVGDDWNGKKVTAISEAGVTLMDSKGIYYTLRKRGA